MNTKVYRCEECGSDEGAEPVSICAKCVAAAAETAKRCSEVLEAIGHERARQENTALRGRTDELLAENTTVRRRVDALESRIAFVGSLLAMNGCDCECEHHPEEHDDDCARCLACRIGFAIKGVV